MKERPILFSAPMVLALLAGTKTQTRRLVTPRPPSVELIRARCGTDFGLYLHPGHDLWTVAGPVQTVREAMQAEPAWRCPYGKPGDRLWVRETFGDCARCGDRCYIATPRRCMLNDDDAPCEPASKRPSIFMPRYASRITLEVTAVRIERLQAISEEDARAEGVAAQADEPRLGDRPSFRVAYQRLWDSLNAKRASWSSNPWVWVVTFRRLS